MASWCCLASKSNASLQIIPPIPILEIVATTERNRRRNSRRYGIQLHLHTSAAQKLRIPKFPGRCTLRTHGAKINRSVSPAAEVIESCCRCAAHFAFAFVALEQPRAFFLGHQ